MSRDVQPQARKSMRWIDEHRDELVAYAGNGKRHSKGVVILLELAIMVEEGRIAKERRREIRQNIIWRREQRRQERAKRKAANA